MPLFSEPKPGKTTPKTGSKKDKAIDAKWIVSFMYTDDSTGVRKQFQFRGKINNQPTESEKIKEANETAATLKMFLKEGWNPFNETPGQYGSRRIGGFINRPRTLLDSLNECYNIKLQQLTGNESKRTYKYIHKHFETWLKAQYLDTLKPEAFTTGHAVSYCDTLITAERSARSFNNYRSVLKVFFNMMVDRELIAKNPFAKIKPAKVTEAEIVPFQDMELKAIRDKMIEKDYNLYVFTQFIFYCLLRPIELLSLQVKHLDLTRNKINLPAAFSKNRKSRSCNIPPALLTIIKGWLKYGSINEYLFGVDMKTCAVKENRRQDVTERHKAILDSLEFESKLSLYSYKYSGVIAAYLAGISIEEIRIQAGHHSLEMTQGYLAKLGLLKPSSFGTVDY